MSAIDTVYEMDVQEKPDIAFCDQDFKLVRLVAQIVHEFSMSVFYRCAAWGASIAGKQSYQYANLSNYYAYHGTRLLKNYWEFGNQIINFSFNCPQRLLQFAVTGQSQKLKIIDDSNIANRWFDNSISAALLEKKIDEGQSSPVCFGITNDFAAHYFKMKAKGYSAEEAVKTVSSRYTNGAPELAEVIHFFQHQEKKTFSNEEVKSFFYPRLIDQYHNEADAAFNKSIAHFREMFRYINLEKTVAQHLGFSVHLHSHMATAIDTDEIVNWKPAMELPTGVYFIRMLGLTKTAEKEYLINDEAHQILFIKTKDNEVCFFLDPEIASLKIESEKTGSVFQRILEKYVDPKLVSVMILSCTPLPVCDRIS